MSSVSRLVARSDTALTIATVPQVTGPRADFQYLDEYQRAAQLTDQSHRFGGGGLAFPLLGFFGEVGSLLSALKKKQRDAQSYIGYSQAVIEELGDSLWYFSNIASRASVKLSSIAEWALHDPQEGSPSRLSVLPRGIPTAGYVSAAADSLEFQSALIALAGKAGLLLNDYDRVARVSINQHALINHLVEIFRSLLTAANVAHVSLREATDFNLRKINSRWPSSRDHPPLFDQDFPPQEQLPRVIEMHIIETSRNGSKHVIQLCNGVEIGSPLTDNKLAQDDYRFHDVFHLSYAGILGWSPCLRALLRLKRKSRSEIDENEDGARAALTEEGVSTLIFQHALRLNYFEAVTTLDYPLLKSVRDFVSGYEVEQCPLWQWERAILDGFEVFRKLRTFRRGVVIADLLARSIMFEPHPNDR